ncbi:major facilitator superfamily domain-containing protein [Leptodontidium sp. 2 PMI_412]|nr:major facilitator superfamily domain-containing protein [Leptodontidium sp. 2 PMI_412]
MNNTSENKTCGSHTHPQGLENDTFQEWKPHKEEYLVMITISLISLMVAIDATILVPVLPTLALALHGTSTDAFWAGTSYLLTSAVFQPFIAALSDSFGRQQLLLASILLFSIGTALCAASNNFTLFFVGRSVQGIGGGGIITMSQVIFSDIVPLRQRPKYFAMVLGSWAIGTIVGPALGGVFVKYLNWRWVFYLNVPFCLAGFVMVPLFVKLNTTANLTLAEKFQEMDWVGSFLFIGSTTSFLIGISWAGIQFRWGSIQVLLPIILGVVGVGVSIYWERSYSKPILRLQLFNNISAIAAYYCAFAQGCILFEALYYAPFYFQSIHSASGLRSGLNLFPMVCLLLPGSVLVSIITSKVGRFRWAIWTGYVVTALGCGLLILLGVGTKTAVWAGILSVFGIGNGMVLTSVNVGIQAISKAEDCGRAASMYAFMRTLGMSVGVSIGSTTFQNAMANRLATLGLPTVIARESEAYLLTLGKLAATDPLRIGVLEAYSQGFKAVFLLMTCLAASGLLASLCIKGFSMDKILDSEYTLNVVGDVRDGENSATTSGTEI